VPVEPLLVAWDFPLTALELAVVALVFLFGGELVLGAADCADNLAGAIETSNKAAQTTHSHIAPEFAPRLLFNSKPSISLRE
jgi:hypothetical protein